MVWSDGELVRGIPGSVDGHLMKGFKILNQHSTPRCVLNDPFFLAI